MYPWGFGKAYRDGYRAKERSAVERSFYEDDEVRKTKDAEKPVSPAKAAKESAREDVIVAQALAKVAAHRVSQPVPAPAPAVPAPVPVHLPAAPAIPAAAPVPVPAPAP